MYEFLRGLRVVEGASFIAAPSCGLHLLQLGAEVIRFDPIGGGPDHGRWPVSPQGASFYWEGLNKGKKSIAIDLARPEGRDLATSLVTAPGEAAGLFVTNYPADGFLSHARLAAARPDMITVRVLGWADGTTAVDYTVNCAVGIPSMTGPPSSGGAPVNHVLPAWDLLAGAYAAYTMLAAERYRRDSGKGQEIRVPLGDLAMATLGHLGQVAEVAVSGIDRPRSGNDLFGAFGRDFVTKEGRRVMLVAITQRQWTGLVAALDLGGSVAALEGELAVSFAADEGARFAHRDRLFPLVEAAMARRTFSELEALFDRCKVCWGPYRTVKEALDNDPRFSTSNPIFTPVEHPSGFRYLTPGAAATFSGSQRAAAPRAPRLGEHTEEILAAILGLPAHEIGRLHDRGIVAGPANKG
ncbi:MAG: CoA transferase [Proteobacteria bacterium]|nr:CoA transferase [Pseudomonadota bacterium]